MSSTNKTTYYDLSQYTANDKPTYLTDYNGDMSKIDAGIRSVAVSTGENTDAIGTLTDLTTDSKSNLVGAINEVDGHADTNATNISSLNVSVSDNTSHIGDLTNLNTTEKNNLVGAINEVDGNTKAIVNNLNLDNITVYQANQMTNDNGSHTGTITIATNSDKSLAKIYGSLVLSPLAVGNVNITIAGTQLRPESEIFLANAGIIGFNVSTPNNVILTTGITLKTNGDVVLNIYCGNSTPDQGVHYFPMLYFIKDFGDTPNN